MFTLKKARTIKRRIQISNKQYPFFFDVIESVHIRIPIVNEREKNKIKIVDTKFVIAYWWFYTAFLIEARRKSAAECRQSSFLMKTSIASRRDSMNPRNPRKTKWTDERRLDNLSIRRIFIGGGKKKNNLCNKRFLPWQKNTNRISKPWI